VLDDILAWLDITLFSLQGTSLSILALLKALLIVVVFALVAKGLGDFLANSLLPRLGMEAALSDALGSVCRYILVVTGFFVAAEFIGFDFTSLKIVLGALSVGIGFGLQNIVNNLVSGLILMFERTVKRGDILQLQGTAGRVLAIGLRSSVIRTRAGHELIVPNGELIASRVDNLSFKDSRVRLDVPVGVTYKADPHQVRELLVAMAKEFPAVLDDPPPSVIFKAFGESSIDFELRVWVDDVWRAPIIQSDLLFGAWDALKAAGIEIPFPQRDLHIRSGAPVKKPETP
jgi:small-conductance mechanosensitive channel